MADKEYTLTFNFGFNSRGDRREGQSFGVLPQEKVMFNAFNYIINDIAFLATDKQQKALSGNIETYFKAIVYDELTKMGQKITTLAVGLPEIATGPIRQLVMSGPISQAMQGRADALALTSVKWRPRNEKYLRRRRKAGAATWFKDTGDLERQLKQASLYTSSYGPVVVNFTPARLAKQNAAARVSDIAIGGKSKKISVGTLKIGVLGRITLDMLTSPEDARHQHSRYTGLFDYLPDDVAVKLAGKVDRTVIEPFLSYYLTRVIPNRVFYALEQSVVNPITGHRGFGRQA